MDRLLHLPPPTTRRYHVEHDLRIPMPDGAALLADRYSPVGTRQLPVVLVRTPYGRRFVNGRVFGAAMARRGFQTVIQSVRGTGGSDGRFGGLRQEKDDGLATAAWLRARSWCDGRLAMVGGSYLGYTQWALAPYVEPPLTVMCPGVTTSGVEGHYFPGGSFALRGTLSWVVGLNRPNGTRLRDLLPNRRHAERMARAFAHVPLRDADIVAVGHELPLWRELVGGADWASADHGDAVAGVPTPVSMVTGWSDHHLPWQLRDFRALADAGRTARITIGPWGHGDLATTSAMIRDQISWLATHLDGVEDERGSPVRVFLTHADRWLDLPAWPPADSVATPLFLGAGGTLAWQPPPDDQIRESRFAYDPADPTPDSAVGQDNRALEARADVLVHTSEPLPHDLDVLGDVRAVLAVRTTPGPADLVVRLCDVDSDGVSRTVCDGLLRLRADTPDAVVELWPTGYRFRRGHRLRVHIAGGAFPRYARNFGTGESLADAVEMVPSRYELSFPARLMLPVRRDASG